MKKVFLFLATAALFASCSDDLLEPNNGFQAQDLSSKGITFRVVEDNATTRGMMEPKQDEQGKTTYRAFFFAEQDRINIWYKDALKGSATTLTDDAKEWTTATNYVTYKATRSEGDPHFTAVSDGDVLNLVNYVPAAGQASAVKTTGKFFAVYPALDTNQGVSYVPATTGDNATPERFKIAARDLSTQRYADYLDMDERLLFAYAEASKTTNDTKEQNKSVGESVDLRFKSPLSQAVFQITNLGGDASGFGNLNSITIKSQYTPLVPNTGSYANFDAVQNYLEKIDTKYYLAGDLIPAFKDNTFDKYDVSKASEIKSESFGEGKRFPTGIPADYFTFTPKTNGEHEIVYVSNGVYIKAATLNVNKKITAGEKMNLYVLPTTGHSATQQEKYTITYTFDNVTLTYDKTTDKNFTANTGGLMFSLDIPATFDYIVTNLKKTTPETEEEQPADIPNSRTLIVNKGNLTTIFEKDNDGKFTANVKWGETPVAAGNFGTIIINEDVNASAFTTDDWDLLNKFTNAKSLTINRASIKELVNVAKLTNLTTLTANGVEKVAKNAFGTTGSNTKLEVLSLTSVTDFAPQGIKLEKIQNLYLNAYPGFAQTGKQQVTPSQLITSELKKVNLSKLTSLTSEYGSSVYITFENFTSLEEVTLNDNGVVVNGNQFKGCISLKSVAGVLNITTADGVFSGCSSTNLTTVRINGDVIPANAFNGSKIKNIYVGKEGKTQVVPTAIGDNAFCGNTAIETMDLSKAETIGEGAFDGATSFKGSGVNGEAKLKVTKVAAKAFHKTIIERFDLQYATETGDYSLGSTTVVQIRYGKQLKPATGSAKISAKQVTYQVPDGEDEDEDPDEIDRKSFVEIFLADVNDASLFTGYKNRK